MPNTEGRPAKRLPTIRGVTSTHKEEVRPRFERGVVVFVSGRAGAFFVIRVWLIASGVGLVLGQRGDIVRVKIERSLDDQSE